MAAEIDSTRFYAEVLGGAPPRAAAAPRSGRITLAVADARLAAEAAWNLGGAVIEPPAGGTALLRDPGGAAFRVVESPSGQVPAA